MLFRSLGAEVGITRLRLALQCGPVANPATPRNASPPAIVVPDTGLTAAQVGYRGCPKLIPPKLDIRRHCIFTVVKMANLLTHLVQ